MNQIEGEKMSKVVPLSKLKVGDEGIVDHVKGSGATRRRLMDMGLVRGTEIKVVRTSPLGDPVEFRLRDYSLTLRKKEAELVLVTLSKGSSGV